jgi:signal transduction histidine kinase
MLKQSLRILALFAIAIICGIAATLLLDQVANISVEKEIRKGLEGQVLSAAKAFKESAGETKADAVMMFVEKLVTGSMGEKIIAVDPTVDQVKERRGFSYLFSFGESNRRLDIFIKDEYLKSELDVLNTPELVFGLVTTIGVFLFATLYSEKRRHALAIKQQLEETRTEYRKAIEKHEALALLGRMSATLAHEMKTPLATISNLIQVLPGRLTDEKFTSRFFSITGEELRRSQQLIDNLLVYGKDIDAINEEWFEFRPFIAELASASGVGIGVCPEFSLNGDRFYLRLLFENLLRNSLAAGGTEVAIALAPAGEKGEMTAVSVTDNGSGFPEDVDLNNLVNPFVTLRSSGGGLGLYLAGKIAAAHKGSLELFRQSHGAGVAILFQKERIRS